MSTTTKYLNLFIRKGLYFLLILVCFISCIIVISDQYINNLTKNFEFNPNIEMLILGDSHAENAYDDSIIQNSINLGQSGDSYFYVYLKLKQLIKCNPNLKRVLVNFSNNQIDSKMDAWIWDDIHLNYKFRKLSGFASIGDINVILKNNPKGYLSNIGLSTRKNLELIIEPVDNIYEAKEWGGFIPLQNSKIDSILELNRNKVKTYKTPFKYALSNTNIYYLQKIIDIAETYEKDIFLIRTPVHQSYHYLNNEAKFDSIYKLHFKSIPFLDFKAYPMFNSQFADDSHLNYKGAQELSDNLQGLIDAGLLNTDEPQKHIDSLLNKMKQERYMFYQSGSGYLLN